MNIRKPLFLSFLLITIQACKKDGPIIYYEDNNIVAHRGAWKDGNCPQNSLASLQRAIEMKCIGSEFDVWLTKDDSLIVEHDQFYAGKNVEKNTYASLAEYRLFNGEVLPTLRQYLHAASGQDQTKLFLEIKSASYNPGRLNAVTDSIINLITEMQMQEHVVYTSFIFSTLQRVRQRLPSAITQFLGGTVTPDGIKSAGISGINYEIDSFYRHLDWVPSAESDSLILGAWTVNDHDQYIWLTNNKFKYVITDDPKGLFYTLDRMR